MTLIPDDPIISCMERTGYPPWWHQPDYPDWLFTEDSDYPEYYDEEEGEEEDAEM